MRSATRRLLLTLLLMALGPVPARAQEDATWSGITRPKSETVTLTEKADKKKQDEARERDVLAFNPYAAETPEALLEQIVAVDWWVQNSAMRLEPEAAEEELIGLQFDLLAGWLSHVPLEGYAKEERDFDFDPAISFTERVLLAWDLNTADPGEWRAARDGALDDFRMGRLDGLLNRYESFCSTSDCVATPAQIRYFVRSAAAHRLRIEGRPWMDALLEEYQAMVLELLIQYPTFRALSQVAGRSTSLERLYGSPRISDVVGPSQMILDMLTLTGEPGYAVIEAYRQARGPDAFLPFPEQIALQGGRFSQEMFRTVISEHGVEAERRRAILATALDHAALSHLDALGHSAQVLHGDAPLAAVSPEQWAWLEEETQQFFATPSFWEDWGLGAITKEAIFPEAQQPELPAELGPFSDMILNFPEPSAAILELLDTRRPAVQAVALAALAEGLEQRSEFTAEDWGLTELAYLKAMVPFLNFDPSLPQDADPERSPTEQVLATRRALVLLILWRMRESPLTVESVVEADPALGEVFKLLPARLAPMAAEGLPGEREAIRQMALAWHGRGMDLADLEPLFPQLVEYALSVDAANVGQGAAVQLLRFHADLIALGTTGLPEGRLTILSLSALDKMNLFRNYEGLPVVLDSLEHQIGPGGFSGPLFEAMNEARKSLKESGEQPEAYRVLNRLLARDPLE